MIGSTLAANASAPELREKLIKIGAKVVGHARYVSFQMAEVAIPRRVFADILRMIAELRPPPITSDGVVSSVVTRLNETTGKVCLYDGKFRISPALQPERASGQRSNAAGVVMLAKIRQLGQIWARTGFHLENVG